MELIENKNYDDERLLYKIKDMKVKSCFWGKNNSKKYSRND